jgi:predicted oxidoreductase
MRISGDGSPDAHERGKAAVRAALEAGYRQFDHADIYGDGRCESLFGELLRQDPSLRSRVKITSKCGVRFAGQPSPTSPKRYDLSKQHIVQSVEGSLRRLGIETLDALLLHRPDYLFDAEEVSEAFARLHESGKVREFGVSNFTTHQVSRLHAVCPFALVANQIEINLENLSALEDGTLDQCQQYGMIPEAWSPLRGITYAAAEAESRVRAELKQQAARYELEEWVVVLAWLLAHPAGIVPLIGSIDPERILAARNALGVDYTRDDWYRLLAARLGSDVA